VSSPKRRVARGRIPRGQGDDERLDTHQQHGEAGAAGEMTIMEDPTGALMAASSTQVMAQLAPQMATLTSSLPGLLALGPNVEQLVNMGKAMFQGAMKIPAASPVQANYIQGIQQLADVMKQSGASPLPKA
jgi:hypothetical protein